MIAKISRGWNAGGLLRYLMGPGRFNQHTTQRVIAAWDGAPELHQPPPNASVCGFDVAALSSELNAAAIAAGIPLDGPGRGVGRRRRGPIWHCSLRNAPGDPVLSDARWAQVAADLLHRTGIAQRGDLGGCRWVVVRHAADHVHIAAMLVRQDNGGRVHPYNDFYRAREACRAAERRFGLTSTGAADRAAAVEQPTRGELEKAARRGRDEPSRVWLRRAARVAAVQAQDPEQFFRRLTDLGVLVLPRELPRGHLVGYSVAAVGDRNARGLPVWFSGGRLAPDLSLPKLRARWRSAQPPPAPILPAPGERARPGRAERAAAVADATTAARAAATAIRAARTSQPTDEHAATDTAAGDTGPGGSTGGGGAAAPATAPAAAPVGSAVAHATGDLLTALCRISQRLDDPVPWAVSNGFDDRAARSPTVGQPRRWPAVAGQLRTAASRLIALRSLNPRRFRGNDGADDEGFAELVLAAATLAAELAALFEAHRQHARAAAARRVSYTLRQPIGQPRAMVDGGADDGRRRVGVALHPPTRRAPSAPTASAATAGGARPAAAPGERRPRPDHRGPARGPDPGIRRGRRR